MRNTEALAFAILDGVGATKGPSRRRFGMRPGNVRRDLAPAGFSLLEAMIASAVLGIAVAGLAVALAAAHQNERFARERGRMLQVGRALLEDIAATPFLAPAIGNKPGYAQGELDRSKYDDVFDFNGYSDAIPLDDLTAEIAADKDVPRLIRRVMVRPRSDPSTDTASPLTANFAYVGVTVTGPSGDSITLPFWQSRTVWRR
mgnify:CR=1 FL=1